MRRTLVFTVVLLVAASVAAQGLHAASAHPHRKAASTTAKPVAKTVSKASSRFVHSAGSRTSSTHKRAKLSSARATAGSSYRRRRTPLHRTASATLRSARYMPAVITELTAPDYKSAYQSGYQAGRAAALEQLRGNGVDEESEAPSPEIPQTAVQPEAFVPGNSSDPASAEPPASRPKANASRPTSIRPDAPESSESSELAALNVTGLAMPAPLRGSLASLTRQNIRSDDEGLERIEDEADLTSRIEHKLLVPVPVSAALTVNPNLPEHHRYCRPWTARFLADLARAHNAAFHKPIEVSSAVRTVEYQKHLMYVNGNAAPAEGDIVSPHLTGATIDIAKQGMTRQEMAWMRSQLLGLQNAGKIDVEEEFEQACFHITVYKNYVTPRPARKAAPASESDDANTQRKPAQPSGRHAAPKKPASQLPADLAVGGLSSQG